MVDPTIGDSASHAQAGEGAGWTSLEARGRGLWPQVGVVVVPWGRGGTERRQPILNRPDSLLRACPDQAAVSHGSKRMLVPRIYAGNVPALTQP